MSVTIANHYNATPANYAGKVNNRNTSQDKTGFQNQVANGGKGHMVYMMTPERIYSGGNGTGLSFYIEYAEGTSENDPTVIAKGVDEKGREFEQTIHINDINPRNASLVEMRALETHYQVNKGMGLTSLPHGTGDMGLHDRRDFISLFEKNIEDMQNVGRYDLSLFYTQNKNIYLDLIGKTGKEEEQIDFSGFAPNAPEEVRRAFMEASEETGYREYTGREMMSHISQILVTQMINRYNGVPNPQDVFGSSVASALQAAKKMLYDLENPLVPISQRGENVAKYEEREKEFYRRLIEKLESLGGESRVTAKQETVTEESKAAANQETVTEESKAAANQETVTEESKTAANQETVTKESKAAADQETRIKEREVIAEQEEDYRRFLQEKMNEIFVKIQKGDAENSYQIGSQSFTEEEWDNFLEKFDSIEEAIKKLMKEEQGKREAVQTAETSKKTADTDLLTAESTSCIYPTADPEDEGIRYITYYLEDGIYCRKAGEAEDMWSIAFTSKEQYEKVKAFIGQFPSDWNMRFAAHENFWNDFLKDDIDIDGFMEFMEGTNKGVPDYSITVGDSMYVDKEKMQWADYLNPLGNRFYTAEEFMKQQAEIIAANVVNMTKITNSYEEIYKQNHPEYNGEKIFCEYPGGPLYSANGIWERMWQNFLADQNMME